MKPYFLLDLQRISSTFHAALLQQPSEKPFCVNMPALQLSAPDSESYAKLDRRRTVRTAGYGPYVVRYHCTVTPAITGCQRTRGVLQSEERAFERPAFGILQWLKQGHA